LEFHGKIDFYHVEKMILNGVVDNSVKGGQGLEVDGWVSQRGRGDEERAR
jgi:hypothetical protein